MSRNKKGDANPFGIPLGDLLVLLKPTSLRAKLEGNALLVQHKHYAVRVEVVPPARNDSDGKRIRAVVRVLAELPAPLRGLFEDLDASKTCACNAFAALGGLYADGSTVRVGSRLTIYEGEDETVWKDLYLPLLLHATICGSEAITGALQRTLARQKPCGGASAWGESDFEHAWQELSRHGFSMYGNEGLTAELALREGAVSAVLADQDTALLQLIADQPHPELGGGLFCLLQMPHVVAEAERLHRICAQLNAMEMALHDLPPHFGAWCPGQVGVVALEQARKSKSPNNAAVNPEKLGSNVAYASFFPNSLHAVPGIALKVAMWAKHRAQWASAALPSMGVRLDPPVRRRKQ